MKNCFTWCIRQVCTEGRLILEFAFDDLMRIKSWHFAVRTFKELIPRSVMGGGDPNMMESISKNITRNGITNSTLNYLRVSNYFYAIFFFVSSTGGFFWRNLWLE